MNGTNTYVRIGNVEIIGNDDGTHDVKVNGEPLACRGVGLTLTDEGQWIVDVQFLPIPPNEDPE